MPGESVSIHPKSFATHNGTFHADDVTACALLLTFNKITKENIQRTRSSKIYDNCEYVCDVGGSYISKDKRFDHHQRSYQGTLSSAGMVLKYLGEIETIEPQLVTYLNSMLIHGVDEIDNGLVEPLYGHATFSSVISNFLPVEYDSPDEQMDASFLIAVEFTVSYLQRLILRYRYIAECQVELKRLMKDNSIVLRLSKGMPWIDAFFALDGKNNRAQFIVMPVGHQWKLRCIPPDLDNKMQVRTPHPKEWSGLIGSDFEKECGIEGAVFCHKGSFISIWKTKDAVEKALLILIERYENSI